MKKKDVLLLVAFIVAPLGFFAAGVYYGPKIKTWYSAKKKGVTTTEGGTNPDLVKINKIDEVNKTIKLSINNNPEITFGYRTGGVPMAQMISVPGLESTEMALRYVDGKFSVTDGETVLFEQIIETIS